MLLRMKKYSKDYDNWNLKKKSLDERILPDDFFFLEGEIWWAALGVNVGHEIDGKNELYERPVIVLKKLDEDLLWILPVTTTQRSGEYFQQIVCGGQSRTVLMQVRTISNRRLLRLADRMKNDEFVILLGRMHAILDSITTIPSG